MSNFFTGLHIAGVLDKGPFWQRDSSPAIGITNKEYDRDVRGRASDIEKAANSLEGGEDIAYDADKILGADIPDFDAVSNHIDRLESHIIEDNDLKETLAERADILLTKLYDNPDPGTLFKSVDDIINLLEDVSGMKQDTTSVSTSIRDKWFTPLQESFLTAIGLEGYHWEACSNHEYRVIVDDKVGIRFDGRYLSLSIVGREYSKLRISDYNIEHSNSEGLTGYQLMRKEELDLFLAILSPTDTELNTYKMMFNREYPVSDILNKIRSVLKVKSE